MKANVEMTLPLHKIGIETYLPVISQLTEPREVLDACYFLVNKFSQSVPGMDIQHNQGLEGHSVLFGQLPSDHCHILLYLFVV